MDWKVSAIITTYKRSWESINRAIESIVNQSVPVFEIILVDDNGNDTEHRERLEPIAKIDKRVKYLPLQENGGVSHARNEGVKYASGNIVGFLDDDDEWDPKKVELLLSLFDMHEDAGLCFGTGLIIHDDTKEREMNWQYKTFMAHPSFKDMLENDYVGSASVPLIKKSIFIETGGFLEEDQPAEEDYELWIRISKISGIYGTIDRVFIKHMDATEHISRHLKNNFLGFRNIYKVNKDDYKGNRKASIWIYWNISRFAVKSFDLRGIPYVFKWFFKKIGF